MSTDVDRLRRKLTSPVHDWRFWASVSAALMAACATIGMVAVIRDRNDWRQRFEVAAGQQACRSQASADVNLAGYRLIGAIGQEVVALNEKDQSAIDAVAAQLPELTRNVATALQRQQEAVQDCLDPAYIKAHT